MVGGRASVAQRAVLDWKQADTRARFISLGTGLLMITCRIEFNPR